VALGEQWLAEIKTKNFSKARQDAIQEKEAALELMDTIKDFVKPVNNLKDRVNKTEADLALFNYKLDDLTNHSRTAQSYVSRLSN
jgi:uncharacterized protein YlxW (UPF0749 family)